MMLRSRTGQRPNSSATRASTATGAGCSARGCRRVVVFCQAQESGSKVRRDSVFRPKCIDS